MNTAEAIKERGGAIAHLVEQVTHILKSWV